jgi:hypothetical protein
MPWWQLINSCTKTARNIFIDPKDAVKTRFSDRSPVAFDTFNRSQRGFARNTGTTIRF